MNPHISVIFIIIFLSVAGCLSETPKQTFHSVNENITTQPNPDLTTSMSMKATTVPINSPTIKPTAKTTPIMELSKVEIGNYYNKPIAVTLMLSSIKSPVSAILVPPDKKVLSIENIKDGHYFAIVSQGTNWNQEKMKFLDEQSSYSTPAIDMKSYTKEENGQICNHFMILRISVNEKGEIISAAFDGKWCSTK